MNCLQGKIDRDNRPVVRRAHILQSKYFLTANLLLAAVWFLTACSGREAVIESLAATTEPPSALPASDQPVATTAGLPTVPASTLEAATQAAPHTSTSQGIAQPTEPLAIAQVIGLPDASGYTWRPVVSGLNAPVGLINAGDGSGRIFIIEQGGLIRILQDGILQPAPFLDISDRAVKNGSEQGLLGLEFHPKYAQNGYFFVNYTDANGDTVVASYHVSAQDPNLAEHDSEVRLMIIPQPFGNHNGGGLAFGPDGYLYLGLGDGGSAGDPQGNGQNLASLLGKILRIDVDNGDPYAVPPDNPYADGSGRPEIWATGLRNPWRFSFDRLTGDLYIGDVGQNQWEEVDYWPAGGPGGANFGWNYMEAAHPFQGAPPADLELIPPVAEYGHDQGCSVTGGVVYRGERLPNWQGVYLYGDYCSGRVWGLLRDPQGNWQRGELFGTPARIASFGEDEPGEVYLVDHGGTIFTLTER